MYLFLAWFTVVPSLRRVWISAIDAWIILLFITWFWARKLAGATRRGSLPACLEIAFALIPYKARINLKKSPSFTIFQGEEVFLMCYWAKQSLPRRAWASLKPGSWGSSCLSLWVLKPSLMINMNLCFLVKMCCPTTLYRYFCNLLESCSSCPWSPNVWSTQCRWGAGALEQVCLCFKCIIFFLTRQSSYFLFLLDFSLGLTKSKDKSAFSTVLHERTGWVDRVWDWQGCMN